MTEVEQGKYQLQQAKQELNLTSQTEAELAREQDAVCKRSKGKDLESALIEAREKCEEKKATEERLGNASRIKYVKKICDYRDQIYKAFKENAFECVAPCPGKKGVSTDQDLEALNEFDTKTADRNTTRVTYVDAGVKKEATLFLRAPEGILYYLGELMRVEEREQFVPEICIEDHLEPLFVAFLRPKPNDGSEGKCPAIVSVQYNEAEFIIPNAQKGSSPPATGDFQCPKSEDEARGIESGRKYVKGIGNLNCSSGRSMQALSLLTQLIALQKSAKDAPTTTVIRAISQ